MEPLSWTGAAGTILNPIFQIAAMVLAVSAVLLIVRSFGPSARAVALAGMGYREDRPAWQRLVSPALIVGFVLAAVGVVWSSIAKAPLLGMEAGIAQFVVVAAIGSAVGAVLSLGVFQIPERYIMWALIGSGLVVIGVVVAFILIGMLTPSGTAGILGNMADQLTPTWISLVILFVLSIRYKRRLGLYGQLFDNPIGMIGFGLVMFWVFTAIFSDWIVTQDPLIQISGMKNKVPGTPVRGVEGAYYLLGGDNLARDVFSRLIAGSRTVLSIAPAATAFAFMVGITLGLPAGYFRGPFDTALSFIANLVLAFPVILLFYLLVTPEIRQTGVVTWVAAILFIFPVIFFWVLMYSRWRINPRVLAWSATPVVAVMLMFYFGTVFEMDPFVGIWTAVLGYLNQGNPIGEWMQQTWENHEPLVSLGLGPEKLNIFVSVVFVNSPTIFRIVRGLTMDIQTRDYVAAAQTRGEGPWYIMLWEILPNARGPLIVDFCLRIGYTTILLGTLGFFGLGLSPESPDWGATINEGRKLLTIYVHPALPPAIALMSLVLGLNLLADGLREESLKD